MVTHTGEFRDCARSSRGARLSTWPGLARADRHYCDCGGVGHSQLTGSPLALEIHVSPPCRGNVTRVDETSDARIDSRGGCQRGRSCHHRVDRLTFATTPVEKVRTVTTS